MADTFGIPARAERLHTDQVIDFLCAHAVEVKSNRFPKHPDGWRFVIEPPVCMHTIPRALDRIGAFSFTGKDNSFDNAASLGRFCALSSNLRFGPAAHPTSFLSVSNIFYANKPPTGFGEEYEAFRHAAAASIGRARKVQNAAKRAPVIIGNDVWIGAGSIIMPGVSIGDGSVVGAHSVVTRDVPPYTIVAGAPARVIRPRFPKEIADELLRLRWWDCDLSEMADLDFTDIEAALRALQSRALKAARRTRLTLTIEGDENVLAEISER